MTRPACALLAALLVSACSRSSNTGTVRDTGADAAADVFQDQAAPVDAQADAASDAALETGFACTPPAAAVDSRVDGGFGCTAGPAYTVNGSDVCNSAQYAYGCYGATAPDSLQCHEFAVPNPPDTTFYCCPCMPPSCSQPLAAGCAQPNPASCPMTLGAAQALCEWDAAAPIAYGQLDCGAYVAWVESKPTESCTYYYDKTTGALVAVFCSQGQGVGAVTTCLGGPTGFTPPSCGIATRCDAPADAGADQ